MNREVHVRFWESQGVRFPLATHLDQGNRRELILSFIDIQKADFPINVLCRVLAVSRSAYYRWCAKRSCYEGIHRARESLKEKLLEAFRANRRIYGAPRLTHELRAMGVGISRATVSRLMAELSITGACGRAKTITTRPDRHARKSSDLVQRNFSVDETDKLWVSDLTYIGTREGWLYLVCNMDACSRRILGYSMSDSMDTQMFIDCLDKARSTRGKVLMSDTIFHSDHGSQYTSNEFREMLRLSQFSQSMGSVGDSYDNAMAEALLRVIEEGARISNSLRHQRGGKNRDLRLDSMVQPEEKTFKSW